MNFKLHQLLDVLFQRVQSSLREQRDNNKLECVERARRKVIRTRTNVPRLFIELEAEYN